MIIVKFQKGNRYCHSPECLWQYDYGQTLRIEGLNLPTAVEVHFSICETEGQSITRIGTTKDGVTEVPIPGDLLINNGATSNYNIFAYVYVTDENSGQTEYKIDITVKVRPRPESDFLASNAFGLVIQKVNEAADRAETAAEESKNAKNATLGTKNEIETMSRNTISKMKEIQTEVRICKDNVQMDANRASDAANYARTAADRADDAANSAKTAADQANEAVENTKGKVEMLTGMYNAVEYGLNVENTGLQNSTALQNLIDTISGNGGGTIYIPSGEYIFAQMVPGDYGGTCVFVKNNVNIVGDGASTILLPTGTEEKCFNMFGDANVTEFTNIKDTDWKYTENCIFEDFVIDGKDQHSRVYSTSGKGFALVNLKNCHWRNVVVKNMDATGFGMDCPVNCSVTNCVAENCGKAATADSPGASGFGIGFGRSIDEYMFISNCRAIRNKRFGFFFEHQRRFWGESDYYPANYNEGFMISNCISTGNEWNYGCIQGFMVTYQGCYSRDANKFGYYLENSQQCNVINCVSDGEGDTAYTMKSDGTDGGTQPTKDNKIIGCISKLSKYACKIVKVGTTAEMTRNVVKDCYFNLAETNTILMTGEMQSLILQNNVSTGAPNVSSATIENLVDAGNSWNAKYEPDNSLRIVSFVLGKESPQIAGTSVLIEIKTEGGVGELQYRFYRIDLANNTTTVFKDWNTSSRTYCNPKAGKYIVYAEARDAAGSIATTQTLFEWTTEATE